MAAPLQLEKLLLLLALAVAAPGTAACSSSSSHDEYHIIRKTDSDGKQLVVAVDDNARLSCTTNVDWKRCFWKPPRNGVRQVRYLIITRMFKKGILKVYLII